MTIYTLHCTLLKHSQAFRPISGKGQCGGRVSAGAEGGDLSGWAGTRDR